MRRVHGWILGCLCLAALMLPAAAPAATSPRAALSRTLSRLLAEAGGASGAKVEDLTTAHSLFSSSARTPRMPASVEKLYTTSTALKQLGPQGTLTTSLLGSGKLDASGVWRGNLYLRGGGDPTFGASAFDQAAYGTGATMERLVSNLVRQTGMSGFQGQIVGDESVFDSVRGTPATGWAVSSEVEGELSGLAYDRGFTDFQGDAFQYHPALFAAQRLRDALRAAGVRILTHSSVRSGATPAVAGLLATVHSPRMSTLIQLTNTPSDNFFAEMLLKGLGASFGAGGNTAAGAGVVRSEVAQQFGIRPRIVDGSGLSRSDHTSPQDVVTALTDMADVRGFVNSLSLAGVSGTTQSGLAGTAAQGRCRLKTGTLHDVANLAGYCNAQDGHRLAFAVLMNSVDPTNGHDLEYQMAVALAKYNG